MANGYDKTHFVLFAVGCRKSNVDLGPDEYISTKLQPDAPNLPHFVGASQSRSCSQA